MRSCANCGGPISGTQYYCERCSKRLNSMLDTDVDELLEEIIGDQS